MVGHSSGTVQKSGNVFFKRCEYFMGTTCDGDVPDRFDLDGRGTSIRVENEESMDNRGGRPRRHRLVT